MGNIPALNSSAHYATKKPPDAYRSCLRCRCDVGNNLIILHTLVKTCSSYKLHYSYSFATLQEYILVICRYHSKIQNASDQIYERNQPLLPKISHFLLLEYYNQADDPPNR